MNKISADHLARRACVYIRQSTPVQVKYNLSLANCYFAHDSPEFQRNVTMLH